MRAAGSSYAWTSRPSGAKCLMCLPFPKTAPREFICVDNSHCLATYPQFTTTVSTPGVRGQQGAPGQQREFLCVNKGPQREPGGSSYARLPVAGESSEQRRLVRLGLFPMPAS